MKKFLRVIACFLIPVMLVYGLFSVVLWRSGELTPTTSVIDSTLAGETKLFGLAYRDETQAYKHAMASAKSAELLVLGTSRSMQFRAGFFQTDSFYNAGGSVPYLPQALNFLERLPKESLPRHLLLVLDQYFFNEIWSAPGNVREIPPYTFEADFAPIKALRRTMADAVDGKYEIAKLLQNSNEAIGMAAAARGAGFYPDGSYSYGTAVLHPEASADAGFADTLERIQHRTKRFEAGEMVSPYSIEALAYLLEFCDLNDILVTAVIPPYAPTVWKTMEATGDYSYIPQLYPKLYPIFAYYGYELFDYTYLPETTDEMYIDGFHGSDRVYALICVKLAQQSTLLHSYLDEKKLIELYTASGNPLTVALPAP